MPPRAAALRPTPQSQQIHNSTTTTTPSQPTSQQSSSQQKESPLLPTSSNSRYWLVKAPRWLVNEWLETQKRSSNVYEMTPLAHIQLHQFYTPTPIPTLESIHQTVRQFDSAPLNDKSVKVKLVYKPVKPENQKQPTEYNLRLKPLKSALIFSDKSTLPASDLLGQPCRLLGAVNEMAELVPIESAAYHELMKRRLVGDLKHKQKVQFLRPSDDIHFSAVNADVLFAEKQAEALKTKRKRRHELQSEQKEKRFRGERCDVEHIIIKSFEEWYQQTTAKANEQNSQQLRMRAHYLSFKQLEEATQQPKAYLNSILSTLCIRETKGEFNNLYRLKDEFTQHPLQIEGEEQQSNADNTQQLSLTLV